MAATTMAGSKQYVFSNISAEFSKDHDLFGSQDPYIIFELGDDSVHTKVAKSGGVTPVWDEDYTLDAENSVGAQELKVVAYNKNTLLPDGLLGRGNVTLDSGYKTVMLVDKKGTTTGQLTFNLSGGSGGMGQTGAGYATQQGLGANSSGTGTNAGLSTNSEVMGSNVSGTRGVGTGMGVGTGIGAAGLAGGQFGDNTSVEREAIAGGERTVTNTTTVTEERGVGGGVCDSQTFVKTEDRPTVREVKNYILEHRPVEKKYVVETKYVGERGLGVSHTEHINTEENIVQTTPARPPCEDAPTLESLTEGNGYQRTTHTNACADGTCGI